MLFPHQTVYVVVYSSGAVSIYQSVLSRRTALNKWSAYTWTGSGSPIMHLAVEACIYVDMPDALLACSLFNFVAKWSTL